MGYIKTSLEPEPGWIQKLLCVEGFKGIRSEVIVEGPFFQMGVGDIPLRRVQLGLTAAELVIASQNVYNIQEEENRFDFDVLLPLPLIRLFIPCPHITRLTICTCCGDVLHFHFDYKNVGDAGIHLWEKWWEEVQKISGSETSKTDGYIIWNSKYIITSDELSKIRKNPEYKVPIDRMNVLAFAQHTPGYRCVRSVPVQTLNITKINHPKTVHLGLRKQSKETVSKKTTTMCEKRGPHMKANDEKLGDHSETRISRYAEVLIPVWYPEDHKIVTCPPDLKKSMSFPCLVDNDNFPLGHIQRIISNKPEEDSHGLRESSSSIDTISTMSALTKECGEFDKVLSCLLVGCESNSKGPDPKLFGAYKKMEKIRRKVMSNKGKLKTSLYEVESSDSDFSIDVIVDEIQTSTRSGAELWQIARRLVMANRGGTHLDDLVQTVVFKTYLSNKSKNKNTVLDFSPEVVAKELTLQQVWHILTINLADFQNTAQYGRPGWLRQTGIEKMIRYGYSISLFVMQQILDQPTLAMRVKVICFFIQVCGLLLKSNDYQTLACVINGLSLPPVTRLHWSLRRLQEGQPGHYRRLKSYQDLFSGKDGFLMYAHLVRNSKRSGPYIMRMSHFLCHFNIFNKVENMQYYNANNIQEKQSKNMPLSKTHLKTSGAPLKKQMFLQKVSQDKKAGHVYVTDTEAGEGKKRHSVGFLNKIQLRKNSAKFEQTGKEKGQEKFFKQGSKEKIKVHPEVVESDDVHMDITQGKSVEVDDNHVMDTVYNKPVEDTEGRSSTAFETEGPHKDACCLLGDEKNGDKNLEIIKTVFSELELCEHKKYWENCWIKGSETHFGSASSPMQKPMKGLLDNVPGERRLSILGGDLRRRSLFEDAVENNQNGDCAINDAIEAELTNMKKRGSLSLALFRDNVTNVKPCNAHLESLANSIKEKESLANSIKENNLGLVFFTYSSRVKKAKPDGNRSNNAKREKPSKTSKQMKQSCSRKMEIEVPKGCHLCGNGPCLYSMAPWQELLKCQLSAAMYNIKHHDRFRTFFYSSRSISESNLFSQSKFTES